MLSLRLFGKLFQGDGAAALNNLAANICLVVNGTISLQDFLEDLNCLVFGSNTSRFSR